MEDELIELPAMHRFAGFDFISDSIPDETTIVTISHLVVISLQVFQRSAAAGGTAED
jgi:IS5 family transposase